MTWKTGWYHTACGQEIKDRSLLRHLGECPAYRNAPDKMAKELVRCTATVTSRPPKKERVMSDAKEYLGDEKSGRDRAHRPRAEDDSQAGLRDQGEEAECGDGGLYPPPGEDHEAETEALERAQAEGTAVFFVCEGCRAIVAEVECGERTTWPLCSWCTVLRGFEVESAWGDGA